MKVLLTASECSPFVKVGGIADVIGSLPIALKQLGVDVRVALPFYKNLLDKINASDKQIVSLEKVISYDIKYGSEVMKAEIFKTFIPQTDIPVYLIYNINLISNGGIYFTPENMASPSVELDRFAVFSKIVASFFSMPNRTFEPDIIHCNDWHTGMIPQIIQNLSRFTKMPHRPRTIFTIHNLAYQGFSDIDVAQKLGMDVNLDQTLKWDSQDNNLDFILQGIVGSDYITTVSPHYAEEIQTPQYGEGMHDILKTRSARLTGILNGISYDVFNPKTDEFIKHKYDPVSVTTEKAKNKAALQEELGLEVNPHKPLLGIASRLVSQKGLDLVADSLEKIVDLGYQVVVLGSGDPQLEFMFNEKSKNTELAKNYKSIIKFSEEIARKIYAASDMFLVPSRYEPCGLTQIIAMKYGSVPIVRDVGGLHDTVEEGRTGFVFYNFSAKEMLDALGRALVKYTQDKIQWNHMVQTAMKEDFSWDMSAKKYINLYRKALDS